MQVGFMRRGRYVKGKKVGKGPIADIVSGPDIQVLSQRLPSALHDKPFVIDAAEHVHPFDFVSGLVVRLAGNKGQEGSSCSICRAARDLRTHRGASVSLPASCLLVGCWLD